MKSKSTFKNLDAIPTWKIGEILNSPHCTGIDGKDYEPVREELQGYYWKRLNDDSEATMKAWEIEFKAQFKAMAKGHKRKTA